MNYMDKKKLELQNIDIDDGFLRKFVINISTLFFHVEVDISMELP